MTSHVGPAPPRASRRSRLRGLRKRVVFDETNDLRLDAWIPSGVGPHPVVVLVHGGGWEAGDRVTYIAPDARAGRVDRGLAWVSIDYRLTPDVTNREQVADVAAALEYLRRRSALSYGSTRLAWSLVGESASGQLVAHLAARERGLAGVVSFYGVYDLEAMAGDPAQSAVAGAPPVQDVDARCCRTNAAARVSRRCITHRRRRRRCC